MTTSPGQLWYAAYGSNLHWSRLRCYLEGGRAPGARRVLPPCRDQRPPRASLPATLPFPLFFAGASPTWGGGTAFVDPTRRHATTFARLYLVSTEQLTAIVAGECGRPDVSLPAASAALPPGHAVGRGPYSTVVSCGERRGLPVMTVTGAPPGAQPSAPRPAYVRTVAAGLAEAHGLAPVDAATYLSGVPGIAGRYRHDELVRAITGAEGPSPA